MIAMNFGLVLSPANVRVMHFRAYLHAGCLNSLKFSIFISGIREFCPKTTIKLVANAAFNDNLPNRHYDKQLSEISS